MMRKTLIILAVAAALGVGAGTADARMVGGSPQGFTGAKSGMMARPGVGGWSKSGMMARPGVGAGVRGWGGVRTATLGPRTNFAGSAFRNRNVFFHNRFRNRNAFFFGAGVGFAGGWGYDSCWVWTPRGLRWVCGYGYPYGGYGYPYGGYGYPY